VKIVAVQVKPEAWTWRRKPPPSGNTATAGRRRNGRAQPPLALFGPAQREGSRWATRDCRTLRLPEGTTFRLDPVVRTPALWACANLGRLALEAFFAACAFRDRLNRPGLGWNPRPNFKEAKLFAGSEFRIVAERDILLKAQGAYRMCSRSILSRAHAHKVCRQGNPKA